jgi:antitoxin YefM
MLGHLARLIDEVTNDRETVIITRRGAADVAMIAADELASLRDGSPSAVAEECARLLTALHRAIERTERPQTPDELRREIWPRWRA